VRSRTVAEATCLTHSILAVAGGLLRDALPLIRRRGITLLGVALTNLVDDRGAQLTLAWDRDRRLDQVLDRVRERFGSESVTRGVLVGRDAGPTVPLLPD
jgi:DNA polymerase IV